MTEGLVLASLTMFLTGIYSPQIWHTPIPFPTPLSHVLPADLTIIDIWIPTIVFTITVGHIPACVYNVYLARRARNLPLSPLFLEWTPFFLLSGTITGWLYSPYSTLLADNHLVLFCVTISFVFGRMTTKIILAHLTRQPFPYFTVLLVPLIAGALLVNLPLLGYEPWSAEAEWAYLWAYCVGAAVVYARWAYLVVSAICEYLDINCLTITERLLPGGGKEGVRRSERIAVNGAAGKGD